MQKTPGNTPEERARYWTGIINAARAFPAGVAAYCAGHEIKYNTYYTWFRKLHPQHPEWTELPKSPRQTRAQRNAAVDRRRSMEVREKPVRRKFSIAEKLRILDESDKADHGEIGAILRREGIYSAQLQQWRNERKAGKLALKPHGSKAADDELRRTRAELEKTKKERDNLKTLVELQKKIVELFGQTELDESR